MGTRSLTVMVADEWEKQVETCILYRQYDGYVEGHGHELADFLSGFEVTHGLRVMPPTPQPTFKTANGASCLFAQIIAHFKKEAGEFYLYAPGKRDVGEEYIYFVTAGHNKPITIRVQTGDETIFEGTPEQLKDFKEE